MKEIADAQRRTVFLALALAAAFQLISSGVLVRVALGPFGLNDLSLVQKVLPAVFAYVIYDLMVLGVRYWHLRRIYVEITRRFEPRTYDSGLDRLVLPHSTTLFGPFWLPVSSSVYAGITWTCARLLQVCAIVLPFAIDIYAIRRIGQTFGVADPVVLLSSGAAVGFMAYALLIFAPLGPVALRRWSESWPLRSGRKHPNVTGW